MISRFFQASLLVAILWATHSQATPVAHKGVLDLRGHNLQNAVELRGDWSFHWSNFVDPVALEDLDSQEYINVPGHWQDDKRSSYPESGYATYYLRILIDKPMQLALTWPEIWSASNIYIDGVLVASYGEIGTSAETSRDGTGVETVVFQPQSTEIDIVIHVSNFSVFMSGLANSLFIGSTSAILMKKYWEFAMDLIILGSLLFMGLYHFGLFALRTTDQSPLWLGIICFGMMFYQGFSSSFVGILLFPGMDFDLRLRYFNLAWIGSTCAFSWFAYHLFSHSYSRTFAFICTGITLPLLMLILFSPPRIFLDYVLLYQVVTLVVLLYVCWIAWQSRNRKDEGNKVFIYGVCTLMVTVINDMLAMQKLLNTPAVSGFGLFLFMFFQSFLLAKRFSLAFRRVTSSEKEIRVLSSNLQQTNDQILALNTNLEKLVEQKTRDIRSIMEHIPLGIFTINNPSGMIDKDHSKYLFQILEVDDQQELRAIDLLFSRSKLSSDEKSQIMSSIEVCYGEPSWNFHINRSHFPLEIVVTRTDGKDCIFDLTWDPMVDKDDNLEKILVTVRDVTELRILKETAQDQQEELELIGEILNVAKPRFLRFIRNCQELIQENEQLLSSDKLTRKNSEVLKILFINMHTLKGAARSLQFKKMTHIFHDVEQYYARLQNDLKELWSIARMRQDLAAAKNIVLAYKRIAREKLGRDTEQTLLLEFKSEEIERYYHLLREVPLDGPIHSIQPKLQDICNSFFYRIHIPLRDIFEDVFLCLPTLAKDLGKACPHVELSLPDMYTIPKVDEKIRNIFLHILRNSLDHGIENPELRAKLGKSKQPLIHLVVSQKENYLSFCFRDDGCGLNIPRLKEIGISRQILVASASIEQIAQVIFDAGLSTANQVSEISGRGVGMNAVKRYIEDLNGTISLVLHHDHSAAKGFVPFEIEILLPIDLFSTPWQDEKRNTQVGTPLKALGDL